MGLVRASSIRSPVTASGLIRARFRTRSSDHAATAGRMLAWMAWWQETHTMRVFIRIWAMSFARAGCGFAGIPPSGVGAVPHRSSLSADLGKTGCVTPRTR